MSCGFPVRSGPRRRLFPLLPLLAALLLLLTTAVACGGGEDAGNEFEIETFEDFEEPTATPVPSGEELMAGLVNTVSGVSPRLSYLYDQQIFLQELSQLNRDFIASSKSCREVTPESKDTIGLDWVVQVYRQLKTWEFLSDRLSNKEVPEDLYDDYRELHERMIRATFIMGFGVTHVIESATLMGPSGRDYRLMEYDERIEFNSLCLQADFYLEGSGGEITAAQQMASSMLSEVAFE